MKNKLEKIPTNSRLSYLAVEIAERFSPLLERGQLKKIELALAVQQGIDGSSALELLAALEEIAPKIGGMLSRLKFSTPQDAEILTAIRATIAKARGAK